MCPYIPLYSFTLQHMSTLPQEAHAWLRPGIPQYGFQLLGVDFMLDEGLQVSACWLDRRCMRGKGDSGTAVGVEEEGGVSQAGQLAGLRIRRRGTATVEQRFMQPGSAAYPLPSSRFPSLFPRCFAQPWLLEFNSSPSIMVEHDDPATQRVGSGGS